MNEFFSPCVLPLCHKTRKRVRRLKKILNTIDYEDLKGYCTDINLNTASNAVDYYFDKAMGNVKCSLLCLGNKTYISCSNENEHSIEYKSFFILEILDVVVAQLNEWCENDSQNMIGELGYWDVSVGYITKKPNKGSGGWFFPIFTEQLKARTEEEAFKLAEKKLRNAQFGVGKKGKFFLVDAIRVSKEK